MKNIKLCPKCNSADIYRAEGELVGDGKNIIPCNLFTNVPVDRYICGDCGYVEHWVSQEHLDEIKKSKVVKRY